MRSAPTSSAISGGVADGETDTVQRFAAGLLYFERALRSAYAAGGQLQIAAIEAQAGEGLSPIAGHQVLAALTAAQASISEALTHSAGGHKLVERLGRSLGYDITGYGDGTKPPEDDKNIFSLPRASRSDAVL